MSKTKPTSLPEIVSALYGADETLGPLLDAMERPTAAVTGTCQELTDARDLASRLARDLQNLSIRLTSAARRASAEERLERLKP